MRKGNTRVRPLNFSHCPNKPAPDTQTIPFFEMPAGNSYPAPSRADRVQMIRDGDWGRVRCEHVTWLLVTCSQESTKDETFILASGAVSILVTNVSVQFPFRLVCSRKCSWFLSCGQATLFFLYKNVVFPAQAEYSYFSADFRLKVFLYS